MPDIQLKDLQTELTVMDSILQAYGQNPSEPCAIFAIISTVFLNLRLGPRPIPPQLCIVYICLHPVPNSLIEWLI